MSASKQDKEYVSQAEEDALAKLRASLENDQPHTDKKKTQSDKDLENALLSAIASVSEQTETPNASQAAPEDEVSFDDIFGAAFAEDIPAPRTEPDGAAASANDLVLTDDAALDEAPAAASAGEDAAQASDDSDEPSEAPALVLEVVEETAADSVDNVDSVGTDAVDTAETEETEETEEADDDVVEDAEAAASSASVPDEQEAVTEEPAAQAAPEPEAEEAPAPKDQKLEQFNAYLATLLDRLPQEGQPRILTEEEAFSALNEENNDVGPETVAEPQEQGAETADVPGTSVPAEPAAEEPAAADAAPVPEPEQADTTAAVPENATPHVKWVGTVPDEPAPAQAPQPDEPMPQPVADVPSPESDKTEGSLSHDNVDRESMTAREVADTIAANLARKERAANAAGKETQPKQDLSKEDKELSLHLGYEADLARVIGFSQIEEMKRNTPDDASCWPPVVAQYTGVEYDMSSPEAEKTSRAKIRHRYRAYYVFNAMRCAITLLLTLFMIYYDLTPVMHVPFLSILNKTERPVLYTAFGALVLSAAILLSGRTMLRGIKQMFGMRPNSVSVPILICLSLLIYDAVAVVTGAADVLQLNCVGVMGMLAVTLRDYMYVKAEKESFRVVSSEGVKYAVEPLYEPMSGPNQNTNKGRPRMMWLARPVDVVRHFRARFHEAEPYERSLPYMLPLAFLLALAAGLFAILQGNSWFVACSWAEVTLLCLLPSFVTLHMAYPWLVSERLLAKRRCTMIGRNAPYLYVGPSMLLFPDDVALEARNSTEMHVKNAGDTTLYVSRIRRLFEKMGGTLAGIMEKSAVAPTAEEVQIVEVTPVGIKADFIGMNESGEQSVHAIVGTWKFMQSNGINAPNENDTRIKRNSKDTGLLYAAFDGELKLIFEVEYGVYAGFLGAVPGLTEFSIATGIYTEDPVLNDAFVGKCLSVVEPGGQRSVPVNVLKPKRHRELPLPPGSSSALIACGSASQTAHGLVAAAGIRQIYRVNMLMRWLAMVVGALLALDMMLLTGFSSMPSLRVILLQLIWLVPVWIITRLYLIREDKDLKNGKRDSVTPHPGNGGKNVKTGK